MQEIKVSKYFLWHVFDNIQPHFRNYKDLKLKIIYSTIFSLNYYDIFQKLVNYNQIDLLGLLITLYFC